LCGLKEFIRTSGVLLFLFPHKIPFKPDFNYAKLTSITEELASSNPAMSQTNIFGVSSDWSARLKNSVHHHLGLITQAVEIFQLFPCLTSLSRFCFASAQFKNVWKADLAGISSPCCPELKAQHLL